ncbi:UNVERIFIED_CONTAM: hypothetical protein FKN15_057744 [Acipenser sinensis]
MPDRQILRGCCPLPAAPHMRQIVSADERQLRNPETASSACEGNAQPRPYEYRLISSLLYVSSVRYHGW